MAVVIFNLLLREKCRKVNFFNIKYDKTFTLGTFDELIIPGALLLSNFFWSDGQSVNVGYLVQDKASSRRERPTATDKSKNTSHARSYIKYKCGPFIKRKTKRIFFDARQINGRTSRREGTQKSYAVFT